MSMPAAAPNRPESSWATSDEAVRAGVVSLEIDADWNAADLVSLISALEETYNVFLAMEIDQLSGSRNLELIRSRLGSLAPDSQLGIPSMRFASPGVISLQGSGEVPHEFRKFLKDLETIGQRRQANKLELESKRLAIAERKAELEREEALSEIDRERQVQQSALELAQVRQQIMQKDIEIASQSIALLRELFEAKYGENWRLVPGAEEEFQILVAGGGKILQQFQEERLSLPSGSNDSDAGVGRFGDGGF